MPVARGGVLAALVAAALPRAPAASSGCPSLHSDVFRSASWVKSQLDVDNVTLLDVRDNFNNHISGAVQSTWKSFTQGAFGSATAGLLEDDAALRSSLQAMGVSTDKMVVVYGQWETSWGEEGRIHWMLKYLGHPSAFILEGGLQVFAALYPDDITSAATTVTPASAWDATSHPVDSGVRVTEQQLKDTAMFLVDVREVSEYTGDAAGWYGVAQDGHVEGAVSYPMARLFDGSCLRGCGDVEADLVSLGWDRSRRLAAYCTGGIRSGFFWSVMSHCNGDLVAAANYDGSMWEWAADSSNVMCKSSSRFCFPTSAPTVAPTAAPTAAGSDSEPNAQPTAAPTAAPTAQPTVSGDSSAPPEVSRAARVGGSGGAVLARIGLANVAAVLVTWTIAWAGTSHRLA